MLYYEDFPVGEVTTFGAYAVTAEEIRAYGQAYDPGALGDEDTALAASPWHVCALLMKLMCEGFVLDSASQGSPGMERLEWHDPVRPGDVLGVRRTTLHARRSASRPGIGLVQFRFELHGGDGALKLLGENWVMIRTRAEDGQ